jgi:hypothetical protein
MIAHGISRTSWNLKQIYIMQVTHLKDLTFFSNLVGLAFLLPSTVMGTAVLTILSLCSKTALFKRAWQTLKVLTHLSPFGSYLSLMFSNEVLFDPVPQGASEIRQVKVESSIFIK